MSAISLKSITGITSITTPAGVDNQLTLHNNNTSEAAKIDVAGNVHVNNHLAVAGVSTFSGNVVLGDASSDNITLNARINSSFIPNANGVMHIGTPSLQWGDLHINGHTNLDNVSIAGVTTTSGNIIIENAEPSLFLTDTNANPDYKIFNDQGVFKIYDTTYSATRLQVATNGEVTVQSNANFPNGITLNPGTVSVVNTIAQRLGNTTAKIRFPANDTFTVETAGDERFRITSAGKIGIGTDNPKQWVSINSGRVSIDVRGDYYGAWIDGDTQGTSSFNVGRWHNAGGRMRSGGSNDNDLVVETQNTSHNLQLQPSGGSVGIGTISPQKKLHVHVSSGGTPVLITGDVPAVVLNPSAANSSDNDRSHFGQATGSNNFCNGVSSGDTVLRGTNSGKLIFGLGTSIKMLITNDGNLGLGDNAPPNFTGYRSLSIHGSTGGALVFGDDGTDEWEVYGGDGVFKIYDRAATTTRLHLTNSYGQFGLNTSSFSDTATALAVKNGRSDSDHTILDIICNDNQTCRLTFSEDSNSSKGSIRYYYTGDGNYMSFYTNGGASGDERLRIDSSGRVIIGTTSSSARLHVKGNETANTYFETTRSTGAYLEFALGASGAGLGYIGASNQIVSGGAVANLAVRSQGELVFAAGGNTEVLRIDAAARLRTRGASNVGHGGMVYIQGYSDPTADETKSNLTVRGEGGNGFACGTYEATGNYASWIQAGYVPNFTGTAPSAIYPLVLQPNGAPVCIGNYSDAGTNDGGLLRIQTKDGSTQVWHDYGLTLEHIDGSNARGQKFAFINANSQGTPAESNSIFRQHATPYMASTTYQVWTDRIVYQHRPLFNQYSWYKFNVHVTSSSRGGSARMGITWSSRHAGPGGYGEYSFAWTDEHHTSRAQVFLRKQHFLTSGGASHGPYNWTSNPAVTVYSSSGGGSSGGFYLRVEGHLDANSSTYDGGVMHHFDIVHNDNNTGGNNTYFEFIQYGSSGPSEANAVLSFN